MAIQNAAVPAPSADFLASLLAEREVVPRARIIAATCAELLPGAGVAVYLFPGDDAPWLRKATAGELTGAESDVTGGTLALLAQRREPLLFQGAELALEDYAHLNLRRTPLSLACVPVLLDDILVAALEVVNFERALGPADLELLAQVSEYSALALATAATYENERNAQLSSITRITQLYDLEKVFNSTLQMDDLLPIVPAKIREILPVRAVNLWLVSGDEVLLMAQDGVDPSIQAGAAQKSGEGIAAEVADSGEALLVAPGDARLASRNADLDPGVVSLIAVPIIERESLVGVLEAVDKTDGTEFDEDDLFYLSSMAETAASALHNASLLQAESKIEILQTLVKVSREITSTLNLDRVLQVVVNAPQEIISYDRAAVALEERGGLRLRAISGETEVPRGQPAIRRLADVLEWAWLTRGELLVTAHGDDVEAEREEDRAKFERYFVDSGVRGFFAIPLEDDQGRVGILAFESTDPDFLNEAHLEMIKVLAGQVTVAVRNAQLYTEVPFIGVLEPLLHRKQQFLALPRRRRATLIALAAALLLFLVFFPLPMRVIGSALVAPAHTARVQGQVDGVVSKVYVREGDPVTRGTILADLEDWDYRAALAAAEARYGAASSAMNRALATNDGAEAGVQRIQSDFWAAEVQRARARLEKTHLRAPADGVIATPRVENLVGKTLDAGDTFAEVVDSSHAIMDVAIAEDDSPLLQPGDSGVVKLESFPTRRFKGRVEVVSPVAAMEGDQRVFYARVNVPNPDGVIRPGMQGRGKVSVGWRSAGFVLFRGVGMWGWSKLWSWFGS